MRCGFAYTMASSIACDSGGGCFLPQRRIEPQQGHDDITVIPQRRPLDNADLKADAGFP